MNLTRRNAVVAAAGGLALILGGSAWRAFREPAHARAPWRMAEPAPADARLDVLRHAILAPNPHNRQPWVITLVGADEAVIRCDLSRRLPETDPFDRQITIGFGAFLGLARIAASHHGLRLDVTPFPEGSAAGSLDARPVAHLRFVPDASVRPDPLKDQILARRSLKRPFDMTRPPQATDLSALAAAAASPAIVSGHTADAARVAAIRAIAWDAWEVEVGSPAKFDESVRLIRIGAVEVDAQPDGISLLGPMIETLAATGGLTRSTIADPASAAFASGRERYRAMIAATPAFFWLRSEANDRTTQLAVGEAYVRANLAATARGLGVHPVSQALQEFAEMDEPRRRITEALGGGVIQMLARVGYGEQVAASPRWPLAAKLAS
jgi:hypothetical protein